MHTNIDMNSRRLIAEFPGDGIKCSEQLQTYCAKITFADKRRYDRIFRQETHKGE